MPGNVREQASLPVSYSGLGLKSCVELAIPSHMSSFRAFAPLAKLITKPSMPNSIDLQTAEQIVG